MTFTIMWWHVPAAVTLIGLLILFIPDKRHGYGSDIAALISVVMWLSVSLICWVIAGVLK